MNPWLALFLWFWISLGWAQQAGRFEAVDGDDVKVYDAARKMRAAKIGDVVSQGDSIVTGNDSEVHLAMEDGGQIAVRPNTKMRIVKFKAEGGDDDASVIGLLQGALRSVTGWIGKYSPKSYQIRTPTATIGVRGTDHETRVIPPDSTEGEAGTYDKVNHGATLVKTEQGETEVRPNQAGFVPHFGKARPQLLPQVPGFFRPARLDRRFEGLHERVHRQLDQKRDERIKAFQERRLKLGQAKGEHNEARPHEREGLHRAEIERRRHEREARGEAQQQRFEERRQREGQRLGKVEHPHSRGESDTGSGEAAGRHGDEERHGGRLHRR